MKKPTAMAPVAKKVAAKAVGKHEATMHKGAKPAAKSGKGAPAGFMPFKKKG